MDFMVRDERASAGWIFGTFQYNGEMGAKDRWENLVPVGMMWGNDPENENKIPVPKFPTFEAISKTPINGELKETVINADTAELPATHLGWNGRLDGPVDNNNSSCMSCHMTSSYPEKKLSPTFRGEDEPPEPGTKEYDEWWMQWFQNTGWKNHKLEKFKDAEYSLDFSLQLSQGLQNFLHREVGLKAENVVRRGPP
jgi:hypothetical protein